jgi:hypothetical protein
MNFESYVQFEDRCTLVKIANSAENLVLQVLQFQEVSVCCILPGTTGINHYSRQSQSHIMTDNQSTSQSWCQAPSGAKTFRVRAKVTLRPAIYCQSVCLGTKPLKTHGHQFFFFQLNCRSHSPYITSSLTRGWVCHLRSHYWF